MIENEQMNETQIIDEKSFNSRYIHGHVMRSEINNSRSTIWLVASFIWTFRSVFAPDVRGRHWHKPMPIHTCLFVKPIDFEARNTQLPDINS